MEWTQGRRRHRRGRGDRWGGDKWRYGTWGQGWQNWHEGRDQRWDDARDQADSNANRIGGQECLTGPAQHPLVFTANRSLGANTPTAVAGASTATAIAGASTTTAVAGAGARVYQDYEIFNLNLFQTWQTWTNTWKQHNVALKFFRDKAEKDGVDHVLFDNKNQN